MEFPEGLMKERHGNSEAAVDAFCLIAEKILPDADERKKGIPADNAKRTWTTIQRSRRSGTP